MGVKLKEIITGVVESKEIVVSNDCEGLDPLQKIKIDAAIKIIQEWKEENAIISAVDRFQAVEIFKDSLLGEVREADDESKENNPAEECKELCDVIVFLCALAKRVDVPIETHTILTPSVIPQSFSDPEQFYPILRRQINRLESYSDEVLSDTQKDLIKEDIHQILQTVLTRFKFLSEGDFAAEFLVSAEKTVLKNRRNRQKAAVSNEEVEKVFGVTPDELKNDENLAKTVHHYFEVLNRALRDVVKLIMPQSEYHGMPENLLAGFLHYFSEFQDYREELVELLKNVPDERKNAIMKNSLKEKRLPELLVVDIENFFASMIALTITFAKESQDK